jgi:glutaredoxin 2
VSEGKLLGSVKNLVIDEAHSLEDVITQSCKKVCSLTLVQKIFIEIEKILRENGESLSEFIHMREEYMFELGSVFEYFSTYLFSKVSRDNKYKTTLIKKDFFTQFDGGAQIVAKLQLQLQDIEELLSEVSDISSSLISGYIQELEILRDIFFHVFGAKEIFETIIPTLTDRNNQ